MIDTLPAPLAARQRDQAGPDGGGAALFAWLLTTAPSDVLQRWEISPQLQLGRALVDVAIQASLVARHFGRTLLHAGP